MAKKKAAAKQRSFADELRAAIRDSGLTHYRIAKDGGVTPEMVDRFMAKGASREKITDPRLSTIERIVKGIGCRLVLEPLEQD